MPPLVTGIGRLMGVIPKGIRETPARGFIFLTICLSPEADEQAFLFLGSKEGASPSRTRGRDHRCHRALRHLRSGRRPNHRTGRGAHGSRDDAV